MKKGETYEGKVVRVEFPNKGIVECEEGRAIVKNSIPGQEIRFLVNKKRHDKCEGRLLEIISKSVIEDNPDTCLHFGNCGGCTYQSVSYQNQLKIKEQQIKDILDSVISDYEYEGITGSPIECEYRNKMEFSFGDTYKNGPLALGMHKRNSTYDIVTVDSCRIVDSDFRQILTATQQYFEKQGIPYYHKLSHEGFLRHLLVRKAVKTGEILVDVVTSTQLDFDFTEYVNLLTSMEYKGTLTGVLHTKNDSLADIVRNDGTDILYGRDYIYEELLGLRFKITAFSFFQTNSLGAEVLYEKVRSYAGDCKDKVIFDLYSGTGTIAQMLAPVASKVVGVEIIPEAVEAAKENAKINGLTNCEFIAGDVLKVVGGLKDKPDTIILDPPREGIHPKAIGDIINFGVDRIVYVSCKPTSLARDLEVFTQSGYKVERAGAVDMFPGTYHTESIVVMKKVK